MQSDEVRQIITDQIEFAKSYVLSRGTINPQFLAFHKNGRKSVIVSPFIEEEKEQQEREKNAICTYLRVMFLATDVQAYVFISEAWLKEITGEEEKKKYYEAKKFPSEYADRIEILMVLYVWGGGVEPHFFEMVRTDGNLTELKHRENDAKEGLVGFSGRMVTLLPKGGEVIDFHTRKKAREAFEKIRSNP